MGERHVGGLDDTMAADSGEPLSINRDVAEVIAGRYEVLAWVGEGGMGSVYKVRDRELDEVVALKMVRREIASSAEALSRFRSEARLARRVTHKNVARTFDVGDHGGERFLTMEYVDGISLGERLDREGRIDATEAMKIASDACEGLAAAHAADVVHRDLKPDNILLERTGRVVLTDFGIAVAVADGAARTMGRVVGTPAYMAPEQIDGTTVDARADLYALGAMMYEMLTGARAWPGDNPLAVAAARLLRPPPDPRAIDPGLNDELAELVLRLLARSRDQRPASAGEVAVALARVPRLSGRPSRPPPARDHADEMRRDKTVVVFPFKSSDAADTILADGVTDDLIDSLSTTPGLRVCARSTIEALVVSSRSDPRELGRQLGAQVVISGSVRRLDDAVRLSARAISVEDGIQLWASRVDRPMRELLVATDELGRAAAAALTTDMRARARAAADPRAIELYFRARVEMRGNFLPDVQRAQPLIEEALTLAPDEPSILATYALVLTRRAFIETSPGEWLGRARVAAERATELAPDMGEPQLALARIDLHEDRPAVAAQRMRRALAMSPGHALAHELFGQLLLEIGPLERANHHLDTAISLAPSWLEHRWPRARSHALVGEWDACLLSLEVKSDAHKMMRLFYILRFSTWRRVAPALADPIPAPIADDQGPSAFINIYDRMLHTGTLTDADAKQFVDFAAACAPATRRRAFFHQLSAEVLAFGGRHDEALSAVEMAAESTLLDVMWGERCPLLEPLRKEPQFRAAHERVVARAAPVRAAVDAPL